ncbi:MAG: terminase large subunit [Candidatus Thiodiazotropha lotti]|nr:terminase large subunit [Candidatus Thiodiazotropha lotti]
MGRQDYSLTTQRVVDFVSLLTHTSGPAAGKPFVLRDWQADILEQIYGPTYDDGRRKVRTALVTIPRKNGKTELAAALALYHLLGDSEKGGQVYSAAADRHQASLVFNAACMMIRNDPELGAILNIVDSQKRIVHHQSGSFYQALSSESKSKHGFSASFIIYDEMAQAPNRQLWDVLTSSMGARAQPLTVVISTMSPDKYSIMYEQYDYALKVREGIIEDETFVPIIYQAPEDADIWDEQVWSACNPALGDFRSLEEMRVFAERAKRIPAAEAAFRNLYLNQLVDAEQRFLSSTDWMACKESIDPDALRGRKCWGGLDLSSTTDLTALVLVFPMEDGSMKVLCWFWVPGERLQDRADRDRVPYPVWRDKDYIIATPGRAIDKDYIVHVLGEIAVKYDIQGIAYDRWRIDELLKQLKDESIEIEMYPWGQGFKDMGPAVDSLETAIVNKTLRHDSPVLDWMASNAVVVSDPAGARKIAKDKSYEKVDGIVALAMALGLYLREPPRLESVYSERGILTISF